MPSPSVGWLAHGRQLVHGAVAGVPTDTRLLMSVTDDRGDGKDSLLRQGLALGHHDLGTGLDLPGKATWIEGEIASKEVGRRWKVHNVSESGERIWGSKVGETLCRGSLPRYHQKKVTGASNVCIV